MSQSLLYIALHAASVATSADEQAVLIVKEGPVSPKTYDILFAMIDTETPVVEYGPTGAALTSIVAKSWLHSPTKIPVFAELLPSAPAACSIAAFATSSANRCCGSIAVASAAVIPKRLLSNRAAPRMNAP
eukprot:1157314-Rhodomonas_salina.1